MELSIVHVHAEFHYTYIEFYGIKELGIHIVIITKYNYKIRVRRFVKQDPNLNDFNLICKNEARWLQCVIILL